MLENILRASGSRRSVVPYRISSLPTYRMILFEYFINIILSFTDVIYTLFYQEYLGRIMAHLPVLSIHTTLSLHSEKNINDCVSQKVRTGYANSNILKKYW